MQFLMSTKTNRNLELLWSVADLRNKEIAYFSYLFEYQFHQPGSSKL